MNNIYPIQFRWVWKSVLGYILVLTLIIAYPKDSLNNNLIDSSVYFIFGLIVFIKVLLQRNAFQFDLGDKFLNFKQGVLSKKERHIPYGVVQNIIVKQDLFDRIFKLASVTVENASQGGGKIVKVSHFNRRRRTETIGVDGGKVLIPGLDIKDAESLKEIILQKMRDNPIDDNQSGL